MCSALRLGALLTALALIGCGDDGKSGQGSGDDGAAPRKSSNPRMDKASFEALQKTEIDGYTRQAGFLSDHRGVVYYVSKEKNSQGGTLKAMVAFEPAGMLGSMDPDVYKGKEALFRKGIDSKHGNDPNLVWSYGALDLGGGRQGIAQYVRSYVTTEHEGREMRHKLASYIARYHDGSNGITISLFVHGAEAKSADDLAKNLSKELGDKTAREIFAAFASSFD